MLEVPRISQMGDERIRGIAKGSGISSSDGWKTEEVKLRNTLGASYLEQFENFFKNPLDKLEKDGIMIM